MVAFPETVKSPPTVKLPFTWALSAVRPVIVAVVIPALSIVALVIFASTEVKFVIMPLSAYIAGTSISLLNTQRSGEAS